MHGANRRSVELANVQTIAFGLHCSLQTIQASSEIQKCLQPHRLSTREASFTNLPIPPDNWAQFD